MQRRLSAEGWRAVLSSHVHRVINEETPLNLKPLNSMFGLLRVSA